MQNQPEALTLDLGDEVTLLVLVWARLV